MTTIIKIWSVADASGNNWNNNDGRETFKAVETAYSLYHEAASIENKIRAAKDLAVAIAADYRAYYPELAKCKFLVGLMLMEQEL